MFYRKKEEFGTVNNTFSVFSVLFRMKDDKSLALKVPQSVRCSGQPECKFLPEVTQITYSLKITKPLHKLVQGTTDQERR